MHAALVDAGPLVALIDAADPRHEECRRAIGQFRGALVTVWPALTEASYLLEEPRAQAALLGMVASGGLWVFELTPSDAGRIAKLMQKYSDLPMDLADASLVAVAEREGLDSIFTLDRRDFSLYRMRGGKALSILL